MRELLTLIWVCSFIFPILGRTLCPLSANFENQCRELNDEIICDGDNFTNWNVGFFNVKIQTLRINNTHLTKIPLCALSGLKVKNLIIEENLFLQEIDQDAFEGILDLENVIIRKNPLLDLPDPFSIFENCQNLTNLYLEENFLQNHDEQEDQDLILPNLKFLSLKGNQFLRTISIKFLKPLQNLEEINLQDCNLERIEYGAMSQLENLKKVDLSKNYKLLQNSEGSENLSLLNWTHLSIADNFIFDLPVNLLENFNETLTNLDISRNLLIELTTFPIMTNLQNLILDDCNIKFIASDVFEHLTNLEFLSIKRNRFVTLPSGIILPNLKAFNG